MVNNEHTKLELIQAQVSFIPEGWKLDKVGKALKIKNNFRKPISQEVRSTIQGNYPYYGPTKIQDYISDYEQDGIYALIGEDGDHFLKYSSMKQTQFISGKCTVNNHAHIIESSRTCDSEWFYIFFKHRNITNFLSRQGAGRFKLNKATLEKLPLLVPPIPEQRKIAKILGTWDKAISTTERLIDNSKQQKKALMQQLLTGAHTQRKRLLDDSGKPFEGEWEEIEVGDLGTIYSGGTPSTTNKAYWDGDIDWITPTDITKQDSVYIKSSVRKISSEGLKNSSAKLVPKGSLLVCTRATIGEMAITAHEMCTNQGFKNIIPNKKTNIEFLFYLLTYQKHKLVSKASGSTFLELSKSAFESMKFRVPVIDEQQKIASVLTNADREIEVLEQQLADLKHEKKALMQQLLTGKRRVKI